MSPIDLSTERLLPLRDLPEYLAQRGLGQRVSMRAVKRWVRDGCHGARLETVVLDRLTLTSVEAVQRWVDAQTAHATTTLGVTTASSRAPAAAPSAPSSEHQASLHLLVEYRVMPTELDALLATLDLPETTRAFAAGMLFRAGLRTPDDVRRLGRDRLLALPGLGRKSKSVVQALWDAL